MTIVPDALFPIIYGPTASGKSAVALHLVDALAGHGIAAEIVTADAFQIYRGMDIGTAKPTIAERARVAHHLVDIVDPYATENSDPTGGRPLTHETFSAQDWLVQAEQLIGALRARGIMPVVVGGTSLYVQSLLFGMFEGPPADDALRRELRDMTPEARRAELLRVDPVSAAKLHFADERRTVRAIEVFRVTGIAISVHQAQWAGKPARSDARLFVLDWEKDELNRRINTRVKQMMASGLVHEVRSLCAALHGRLLGPQSREAIGYKQLLHLFEPHDGLRPGEPRQREIDDAVEQIKIVTRRFGKNQRTWTRRIALTAGTRLLDGSISASAHAQTIAASLLNVSGVG